MFESGRSPEGSGRTAATNVRPEGRAQLLSYSDGAVSGEFDLQAVDGARSLVDSSDVRQPEVGVIVAQGDAALVVNQISARRPVRAQIATRL